MFIIHCCNYIKKYFYFLSLETRYLYIRVIIVCSLFFLSSYHCHIAHVFRAVKLFITIDLSHHEVIKKTTMSREA